MQEQRQLTLLDGTVNYSDLSISILVEYLLKYQIELCPILIKIASDHKWYLNLNHMLYLFK